MTIGDELLLGEIVDTNFRFLASVLANAGVDVRRHVTVGDEIDAIVGALNNAVSRSPLLVVTGGLGVTVDDRTRQALAELAGVRLMPDRELLEEIEVFFHDRKIRMPSINIAQASLPERARKIRNKVGLAPGIHMRIRKTEVFAFPGVPSEMRHLTEEGLIPFLRERNGEARINQRVLRTWGEGETAVAEKLAVYLKRERPVAVAFLPEKRGVTLRFRLKEGKHADPEKTLDRHVDEAVSILGDLVYSTREEELEEVAGYLLMVQRKTVAVAESCTGGRVSDYLTSVPGSSTYFLEGFVPYHSKSKIKTIGIPAESIRENGTVSAETAAALAARVRLLTGADIGIGVTGVAGPESVEGKPVGRVYSALDAGTERVVREWNLPGNRERVKERAARFTIDMLRLHLLGEL